MIFVVILMMVILCVVIMVVVLSPIIDEGIKRDKLMKESEKIKGK